MNNKVLRHILFMILIAVIIITVCFLKWRHEERIRATDEAMSLADEAADEAIRINEFNSSFIISPNMAITRMLVYPTTAIVEAKHFRNGVIVTYKGKEIAFITSQGVIRNSK